MPLLKKQRKIPLKVEDIMSVPPITAPEDVTVSDVARLMYENRIGSVLIVDNQGKLIGIVTERDVTHACAMGILGRETKVFAIMTENPITTSPQESIEEAFKKMKTSNIRHLPVVDEEGNPVGALSMRDITDALFSFLLVLF
ncbi:MAG: CBS domain-containing protein [Desulfurococcales archaeon]|nr:CBS domain-containing protein [Desulfurococcales archaeon]